MQQNVGRPTDYTPEMAARVCHLIATLPYGIKRICKQNDDIPSHQTISDWKLKYPEFLGHYLVAKESQALEITEMMQDELDNLQANQDDITLFTTKFRYYQWHTSKLAPKQFGDKKEIKQEMNISVHEDKLKELE